MTHLKHLLTRNPKVAPATRLGLRVLNSFARHNPLQWKTGRVKSLKYLNVGCGKRPKDHTINLNYEWYPFIDLTWDVTHRLPLHDCSLKGIYSEHVLEHLPFNLIPKVLADWFRVLESEGTLRILVPDAEIYLRTYVKVRNGEQVEFPYPDSTKTPMMLVNWVFREHEHLYAYDFQTLAQVLRSAGFVDVKQQGHNQGRDSNLLIDSNDRECESLRVECVKAK